MAITLTAAFIAQLKAGNNFPVTILELALDSGTVKYGTDTGGFPDVQPIIGDISSLQNKIDSKSGFSTRGELIFTILGRDNFKSLIANNYLKNRRVTRKDGFIASGFAYSDYAATFSGVITSWERKGDELTVTVRDDLYKATKKIPVENAIGTQQIGYINTNIVDVMKDMLSTQLGLSTVFVDSTKFDTEKTNWLPNWTVCRVLTEPEEADKYLNELQAESNSFILHDGERITYKVFAPPVPGATPEVWMDDFNILEDSLDVNSGYEDTFYNNIAIYYDYDESGQDKAENYENILIVADAGSQSTAQWNEIKTKTIKSRWIHTNGFNQGASTALPGVTMYHGSLENSTGTAHINYDSTAVTLTYTPPNASPGAAVSVTKNGKVQLFGADTNKSVRVIVQTTSLPLASGASTVLFTAINGNGIAQTLGDKLLSRFRNPTATIKFDVDINNVAWNSAFIKPTDIKDITTDDAFEHGDSSWSAERVMITSVRPDFVEGKVAIEAIETKMYRRYGFIAAAGFPDYSSATTAQKEYGFIGNSSNEVGGTTVLGYYIW